ncbi:MAG: dephospho-CoA kinase [Candidatus Andeanibacterium colombiense]|uniref:Dephospho-CoA kinase n=1 Tax=Candidatus Andeanibacterium colombiense TaxID=3121345 RepID=A0AAJ5X6K4_9SPHN|nr:MAG: dephospho-CoA kinase [Sphingomonadaceae bacterium]
MSRPFVLGLTGSIGMGKSTVAEMFAEMGVPVFDADACVHRLQGAGGALLPVIEAQFPGTTGPSGVDRAALGSQVFGDDEAMRRLEAIVHPAVAAEREAFLIEHIGARLVVFDIPLLFETHREPGLEAIAVVSADAETQRRRVLARPDMTPERFAEILARQLPDAEKRARADFVIDTGLSLAETRKEVADLVAKLQH